ncbi:hypothetical protein [Celerinatantimonas sp. YJH-8]|uniref:hypothetical protein n=1 Tax=Celerinatantimonas sp. YJH-8 TaxID=3228714 RepID=UPI0038C383E5
MKNIRRNHLAALLGIYFCSIGNSVASDFITPFDHVPRDNWSYTAINKLSEDGLIDKSEVETKKPMERYQIAVLVAKALSKYDNASADDQAQINKLLREYSDDLKAIGVRRKSPTPQDTDTSESKTQIASTNKEQQPDNTLEDTNQDIIVASTDTSSNLADKPKVSHIQTVAFTQQDKNKLEHLPNLRGIIKNYYYNQRRGNKKVSNLYQDVRLSLYGNINKQWSYDFDFLYKPNENERLGGATNDFRSVLDTAPGMASNGASLTGTNLFNTNTTAVIGYQWIGVRNDNWVYNNGLKGISLFTKVKDVNLGAQYGPLDLVYNHGFSHKNTAVVLSAFGNIKNTYVGGIHWYIDDKTNNWIYRINELQIKQPLWRNWMLNLTGAKSNDDTENKLYSLKLSYGEMNSQIPGSYYLYTDYHYVGTYATLEPDGDRGISNGVGLKGFRFGVRYAPFKGVQVRSSIMPWDKVIATGDSARVFNMAVYVEL